VLSLLNWMPYQLPALAVLLPPVAELSLIDVKMMFWPDVPRASSVPSMVRLVLPLNCITVPG